LCCAGLARRATSAHGVRISFDHNSAFARTSPMTTLVRFADILARRHRAGNEVCFDVTDDWQQGRTAYGGLVGAIAACAIRDVLGPERPLRALQVNFVGSVPAGPACVRVDPLRVGKSITQARAIVEADGETACVVSSVLGLARESTLPPFAPTQPATRLPDSLPEVPFMPERMPAFMQHLATRWAEGDPPYSGGSSTHSRIWLALRGDPVPRELLVILFADAMPSPVMSAARSRVFGASLGWSIEFLAPSQQGEDDGWWRADTELTGHAQGYANQVSTIWTPQGEAAARSQQVVAIYG